MGQGELEVTCREIEVTGMLFCKYVQISLWINMVLTVKKKVKIVNRSAVGIQYN